MATRTAPPQLPIEVLAALAEASGRLLDPAALAEEVLAQAARLVEVDAFYLALYEPGREELHFVIQHDRGRNVAGVVRPLGRGPTSWVVRHRRAYLVLDQADPIQTSGETFGSDERCASALHIPLLLGDRLLGVFSVQSYRSGAYPPAAVDAVKALATHVAIALEASQVARAGHEVEDANRTALAGSRILRDLAQDLAGMGRLDAVVDRGLSAGVELLGGAGALLAGRSADAAGRLVVLGVLGQETQWHRPGDVLPEDALLSAVARRGEARVSSSLAAEPEAAGEARSPGGPRPGVAVATRFGSVVVGGLLVTGSGPEWVSHARGRVELLQAVGDQLAAAVNGLHLRGELLTRLEQMEALGRVAHALTGVESATHTMEFLAEEGLRVFHAQRAGVFLVDRTTGRAQCMAAIGLTEPQQTAVARDLPRRLRAAGGLPDPVFPRWDPGEAGLRPTGRPETLTAAAVLPLIFAGEMIGALAFFHDRHRDYTRDEQRLALAFADQAALAIGKSRLLEQVSRITREWQTAFDAAASGLAVVDPEGRILRANRFVADLAEVAVTATRGLDLRAMFPRWPAGGGDPLVGALESGATDSAMLDARDGRLLVLSATPLPDGGLVVALDDVTAVVRLEDRFRRVVQTAHDAIVLTDRDEHVVLANPAAAELFGRGETDLVGLALGDLLPATSDASERRGSAWRFESTLVRPDGSSRRVAVSSAVLSTSGEPRGQVAVLRDVTAEREAAAELERSEARFRALFAAVPLAILTVDDQGRFLSANRAALDLMGLDRCPTEGRIAHYLMPAEREYVAEHFRTSVQGEAREFLFHVRREDGSVREAAAVAVPFQARGEGRATLAIARDVTDAHALQERLSHSEKMGALGVLVSGVAHELNNPLAGIMALAQTLALEEPVDEGTHRVLDSIRAEATRAARIVSDLLTFARQRPLARADTDLNAIVREAVARPGSGAVAWEMEIPKALPVVSADPDQVRQVVDNLLANAEHAMRSVPMRRGRVRTYLTEDAVGCEVADSGPGIPPETIGRIFEPFFTTKGAGEGTGLGLSISHGIIRAHGGDIGAQNRPEGGARFWFELPRRSGRWSR